MTSATSAAATATAVRLKPTKQRCTAINRGVSTLMYAAQQGDVDRVGKILVEQSESVLSRDRTGKTPLHYCCTSDSICAAQAADLLVMAAPDLVDSRDEDGFTPLHLAVIAGNMPLVTFLLANNADVNAVDNEKHTVVHWAAVCGETSALRAVLAAGAPVSTPDVHGGYPLHYAAQMCGGEKDSNLGLQVLQTLLAHSDIVVPVEDGDGRQPLLWAASAGSAKAVLALIRAGASVEASDKDGLTALHCAASRGHTDCIDSLLTLCGASPDVIDSNGCTALHYAVTLGHADATALLLAHGADPNRQDRKGRTPAHCGCAKGQFETVKMIGAHGANLWLRNARGDLPLHEAAASGRRDLVRWLLDMRPSQVNARNNDGRCPLHLAALNDNADMCKILLDAGAQINPVLRTSKNTFMSPLDCALQRGFRSTAKYLQLHGGVPANRLGDARQTTAGVNFQIRENITFWGDTSSDSERENGETSKNKKIQRKKLSHKYEKKRASLSGSDENNKHINSRSDSRVSRKKYSDKNQKPKSSNRSDSSANVESRKSEKKTTSSRIDYRNEIIINGKTEINIHNSREIKLEGENLVPPTDVATEIAEKVISETNAGKRPKSSKNETKIKTNEKQITKFDRPKSKLKQGNNKQSKETVTKEETKPAVDTQGTNLKQNEIKLQKLSDQQSLISNTSEEIEEHKNIMVEAAIHEPPKAVDVETNNGTSQKQLEVKIENQKLATLTDKGKDEKENEDTHKAATIDNLVNQEKEKGESESFVDHKQIESTNGNKNKLKSEEDGQENKIEETNEAQTKETELIQTSTEVTGSNNLEKTSEDLSKENDEIEKGRETMVLSNEVKDTKSEAEEQTKTIEQFTNDDNIEQEAKSQTINNIENDDKIATVESSEVEIHKHENKTSPEINEKLSDSNKTSELLEETNEENELKQKDEQQKSKKSFLKSDKEVCETIENEVLNENRKSEDNKKHEKSKSKHKKTKQPKKDQAYEIIYKTLGDNEDDKAATKILENKEPSNTENIAQEKLENGEYSSGLESDSSTSSTTVKEHKSFRILDDQEANELECKTSKQKKVRTTRAPLKKQRSRSEEHKVMKDRANEKIRKSKIPLSKSNLSKSDKYLNIPSNISDRKTKSSMESRVPSLPNINEAKDKMKEPPRSDSNMSAPLMASAYSDNDRASGSDMEQQEEKASATRRKKVRRRPKTRDAKSAGSDYESSNVIDSGFEPSPRSSRIPKWRNMSERGVNMTSVTRSIQSNIRRYHLERKIFQHLLELKRMQIRAGQHNEAVLVKRAIDAYHQSCASTVGAGRYDAEDYTFKSFEKFLYLSLRKLQKNGAEHLKGLPETHNPLLCTKSTHRCMHATHAYTGIPCAAYLPKMDHHTIPKIGFTSTQCKPGTGFLPTINPKNKAVTLELCHGNDKQIIILPADRLDHNKRYYVTFTVKGSDNSPSENEEALGHIHSKSD